MIAVTMSKQLPVLPPNQAHIPSPHVHGLQVYIVTPSWSALGYIIDVLDVHPKFQATAQTKPHLPLE